MHDSQDCPYAKYIGVPTYKITDESKNDLCGFCHAPWTSITKPTRGSK